MSSPGALRKNPSAGRRGSGRVERGGAPHGREGPEAAVKRNTLPRACGPGEFGFIERVAPVGGPSGRGDRHRDDRAVLRPPRGGWCSPPICWWRDHFDFRYAPSQELGWRALMANLSTSPRWARPLLLPRRPGRPTGNARPGPRRHLPRDVARGSFLRDTADGRGHLPGRGRRSFPGRHGNGFPGEGNPARRRPARRPPLRHRGARLVPPGPSAPFRRAPPESERMAARGDAPAPLPRGALTGGFGGGPVRCGIGHDRSLRRASAGPLPPPRAGEDGRRPGREVVPAPRRVPEGRGGAGGGSRSRLPRRGRGLRAAHVGAPPAVRSLSQGREDVPRRGAPHRRGDEAGRDPGAPHRRVLDDGDPPRALRPLRIP
jgi:hypothetical protein